MKIFAVSDVHGFTSILRRNLSNVGFEINNPNHLLVLCGDLFDRGPEAKDMLKFIHEVDNKIMVKGNHEDLMQEMIIRGYPLLHDIQNRTYDTALQLAWDSSLGDVNYTKLYGIFDNLCSQMVDFYETKRYVFVHGWIPVTSAKKDWRDSSLWKKARWLNGMEMQMKGKTLPDKTIVCGHWHCSWGNAIKFNVSEFDDDAIWDPYTAPGIIAIDRCTAYTKEMNIIVLEDDLIEQ